MIFRHKPTTLPTNNKLFATTVDSLLKTGKKLNKAIVIGEDHRDPMTKDVIRQNLKLLHTLFAAKKDFSPIILLEYLPVSLNNKLKQAAKKKKMDKELAHELFEELFFHYSQTKIIDLIKKVIENGIIVEVLQ